MSPREAGGEAVAVVGLACRFPGASTPEEFRGLLVNARRHIGAVPPDRSFAEAPEAGPAGHYGAFIDGPGLFDAAFFRMSPREAAEADPRQRLALELGWEVLEDARVPAHVLRGGDTGVFIGATGDDYALARHASATEPTHHTLTGLNRALIANRLSYALDLRGPSTVVDTGQSSSLSAVVQAAGALRRGECRTAIAGGVHLNLAVESAAMEARFGGLSPSGTSLPFDARADGYVRGEGGGAVLLKRLADALADGDRVHAVLLGAAMAADGAAGGLTVPGRSGQERVIRAACADAGVAPSAVAYVELHGTGTPVGDPIEAAALGAVLGSGRGGASPVRVGSVKANIGHLSAAAGIAGLIKAVMAVSHRELVPTPGSEGAGAVAGAGRGSELPLDRLGLRMQTEYEDWPDVDGGRCAGVSSFGMGGADCHVIVGEAPEAPSVRRHAVGTGRSSSTRGTPTIWVLSGASEESLRAQARRLRRHIEASAQADRSIDPHEFGLSLATTREAMGYRAAVHGADVPEFVQGLEAIETGPHGAGASSRAVVFGRPDTPADGRATASSSVPTGPGERFCAGGRVDWAAVFGPGTPVVDLPTYAFQRRRHWFAEAPSPSADQGDAGPEPRGTDGHVLRPTTPSDDFPGPDRTGEGPVGPVPRPRPASAPGARADALALVRAQAAEVMGHDSAGAVGAERTFRDLGFDSVMATELRIALERALGRRLPSGLVYDHPTPALLARFLDEGRERVPRRGPEAAHEGDPIAIVSMACRLPGGVESPDDLWRLLGERIDAVTGFPADRGWNTAELVDTTRTRSATTYVGEGGFLRDAALFDAAFFGIGPREAAAMDPQQRVLLEVAWEAVERAGIDPHGVKGEGIGVFVGATASGYDGDGAGHEGYLMTGAAPSVVSGRIAYALGLSGPAVTVDTACSSSLVAVHQAVRALRHGECTAALAGGVCIMATPDMFTEFSAQHGLAEDGRCKPFSADADGTAWAEGAGLLMLERLSDARRRGHRVLAVVRGSAINSDGASNGLTAPNGPAQERVITSALADADLDPADVDLVETHGTGTRLGDPIEAEALSAAYGEGRDRPLLLGALKSNIGHTQAAAGVAGVIKTVMAMRSGVIPASLHVGVPTPHVDWSRGDLALLPEPMQWPTAVPGRPPRAGVSSFGVSGTNAHLILESAPREGAEGPAVSGASSVFGGPLVRAPGHASEQTDGRVHEDRGEGSTVRAAVDARPDGGAPADRAAVGSAGPGSQSSGGASEARAEGSAALPFVLCAATPDALREQARRLLRWIGERDVALADLAWSLAVTRAVLEHRAVVLASERDGLARGLRAVAGGAVFADEGTGSNVPSASAARPEAADASRGAAEPGPVNRPGARADPDGPVFVFPGQGTQWPGMAAELMRDSAVFRSAVTECAEALGRYVDWDPMAVLRGDADAAALSRVDVVQPTLWAFMVALAETWRANGVHPSGVIGHSQGEIAAACVAGGLSIADGAAVVALRSLAITELAGSGAMAAIAESEKEVSARLAELRTDVHIAALNGPSSTVVSGAPAAVDALIAVCTADGADARRVDVDYASHSPHVRRLRDRILGALAQIRPVEPELPFHSTLLGGPLDGVPLDAGYWYRNLGSTVRFAPVVSALAIAGHRTFIEVSPHPALTPSVAHVLEECGVDGAAVATLRRGAGGADRLADAVSEALERGVAADPRGKVGGPLLTAAARAFTKGVPVDWTRFLGGGPHRVVDLPTYPFQRKRHWLQPKQALLGGPAAPADSAFWSAVENGDPDAAARVIGADSESLGAVLPALAAWRGSLKEDADQDDLRYREDWVRVPASASPALNGTWLLVSGHESETAGPSHDDIARALEACGAGVVPVTVASDGDRAAMAGALRDTAFARPAPASTTHHDAGRGAALRGAPGGDGTAQTQPEAGAGGSSGRVGPEEIAGVLSLLSVPGEPIASAPDVPRGLAGTAALVQALGDGGIGAPLWCVTQGAVVSGPGDTVEDPFRAAVWGLGRVAAQELPERWGGSVDLPPRPGAEELRLLCAALSGDGDEDQLAVRPQGLLARRLVRAPIADRTPVRRWRPRGTVLVTGGTGALGGALARRLAARPDPPHLLLTGRRGMAAPGAPGLCDELHALGAEVTVTTCDVSDPSALAALLADVPADRPLTAVLHAAAALDDAPVDALTPERMRTGLAAKAGAALHLHRLTRHLDLDAFILFSSAAGLVGVSGQGNYAPGNAVLDALAHHRRALGLEATAIAWGAWQDQGMASQGTGARLERHGLPGFNADTAMEALRRAVEHADTAVAVARFDWSRFPAAFTAVRPSTLLDRITDAAPAEPPPSAPAAAEPAAHPPADRAAVLLDLVRRETAAVLGHGSAAEVADRRPFKEQGLDSVTALELRNRLATAAGVALPASTAYDHPTPAALAARLDALTRPADPSADDRLPAAIAAVEALLAGSDPASPQTRAARDRLHALATAPTDTDVRDASREELFALIDSELGSGTRSDPQV